MPPCRRCGRPISHSWCDGWVHVDTTSVYCDVRLRHELPVRETNMERADVED